MANQAGTRFFQGESGSFDADSLLAAAAAMSATLALLKDIYDN